MWFRGVVTTVALLLAGPLASAAAPVADVEKWAQRFQQSALKNNEDELVARVREIADPDFNIDSLRSILKRLDGVVGQQPGDFAEQFNEQTIGSFYKRINVAVRFPKIFLFYTLTFARNSAGWQMTDFNYTTNVNEALSQKWPD